MPSENSVTKESHEGTLTRTRNQQDVEVGDSEGSCQERNLTGDASLAPLMGLALRANVQDE